LAFSNAETRESNAAKADFELPGIRLATVSVTLPLLLPPVLLGLEHPASRPMLASVTAATATILCGDFIVGSFRLCVSW
jgi:hypothetical protein